MSEQKKQAIKTENNGTNAIILKLKTSAYYLGKDGKLSKKGGFDKGKVLFINPKDIIVKGGKGLYHALGVSHENIYLVCTAKNCELLKNTHIRNIAVAKLKKRDLTHAEIKKNLKRAIEEVISELKKEASKPISQASGLSYYTDQAFDSADGFEFIKEESTCVDFIKSDDGEVAEEKVISTKQNTKQSPNLLDKVRGSGEGYAFRH